ncbi:chondroitin sulfate proteoglycan 4-like [Brachionichthys hirsutus]|uniref:chondroitin sulfate proteoglycan 4-like n=1 Tax=Brachionichthys hirsutus TaxID=412623 RepID=UPI00360461F0
MGRFVARCFLLLLISTGHVCGVSFYGDGHIHLRTNESSIQTLLHVRFQTSSPAGLLFLAAGGRDFVLLELISGCLQVRLDLGSGERLLHSEKGVDLSDLAWHSVVLAHNRHHVTMTVDQNAHASVLMPGPDVELRVEHGLFVGGASGMNHPRLSNISSGFRGCMDEVVFNGHNLLSSLKPHSGYKVTGGLSLGCSAQFSATEEDPVSFFSSKSFISLPPWEVSQEGVFQCELHPSPLEDDGVILYGFAKRGGFVAVEIRDGHLVATVGGREGGRAEVRSLTRVHSNATWYPIRLHLLPHAIQLTVDEESVRANLSLELQGIRLNGPLFLGGMDEEARTDARQAGFMSVESGGQLAGRGSSFRGCLREMRVNSQRMGLEHAAVTKDVRVGCRSGRAPAAQTAYLPDVKSTTPSSNDRKKPNFLFLRTLEVAEGGQAALEPKHMRVKLDFRKLGVHPSQLMFRIEGQPVHGQLRLDLTPGSDGMLGEGQRRTIFIGAEEVDRTFSMLDLWQGRVTYVHSGSESLQDFFTFSVFSSSKKELPAFLRDKRLHRFDISVSPVNDAPALSLPEGNLFTVVEKFRRRLNTDVLRVWDPDSSPAELAFRCLGNLSSDVGYLEHQDDPGRTIDLFSLNDLENGKISFVHTGVPTSRMAFRVSDGLKLSNTVVLRIVAVPLQHKLVNNTGLDINQGGTSAITTANLAVQVNVADREVEILYDVTELTQYGELQRLHSSGDWKPTTSFTQRLLEQERIRYVSTHLGLQTQNSATDCFKCKISIGALASDEVVFRIVVRWIHFKVTRSKMEVNSARSTAVSPNDLRVISKGVKLDQSDLFFRILTAPKKGRLFLDNKPLQKHSTFSQQDVTDGSVRYELLNRLPDDARDTFSFQVFSTHANSTAYNFRINIKTESSPVSVVNKGLSVLEGGRKVINKDILFAHTASNREVRYSLTGSPKHGQMRRINNSNSMSIDDNVVTFTNQDIIEERIVYIHDDSETKRDFFTFQITVFKPHKRASQKEDKNATGHVFNISVQLVNDQRPVRVVDKVFHVARDGQRLVTLNDLCFRDDDADFEDDWLVYTRRGIPMGELVLASDTSHKMYEFTQRDLEQKKVLFVHRGVSFGRFVLFVSDGKHYVSTLLEVVAQDPYLQPENNTGLKVQRGGLTALTSANLSVSSNLDVRDPQEVTYEVFVPPKHGTLCFKDGDRETVTKAEAISEFTQQDLLSGHLVYQHGGSHESTDGFNVTARVRQDGPERERGRRAAHRDIGVLVKVYLESHRRPPTLKNKHPVVVAEGRNVSVSRGHLEVVHEDNLPSEILFMVRRPPTVGFLQRLPPGEQQRSYQGITERSTRSFTQQDINQKMIIYHQDAAGSTNDSLLLEATNGVTTVGPIRLDIDIIPNLLPLQVSDLTLDEGSSLPLTSDIIKVTNHHFTEMDFLYQVVVAPRHGHLEHSRIPGMPITAFTHTEVEREYVSYIHDGSDTRRDGFTVVANQTELGKHSLPCAVHVIVIPVNDEIPVVVANKGLKVWADSVTDITTKELSAEDADTLPEGLEFVITPPSNGHLALKSAPSRPILNFTQYHLQTAQLVFLHSGALSGGFHFQVNDGVNFAPRQIFSTTASSLVLTLKRNQPLEVYPGSATVISDQQLQAVTNGGGDANRSRSVLFAVTAPPNLGRLIRRLPDNSTQTVSTFTQSMVNDGVIFYDQTRPGSVGWSAADSFSFTVSSPPAFLPPHTFVIAISYQADRHHDDDRRKTRLLNNAGAVVAEGGKVTIDGSKLDASNLLGQILEPHRKEHRVLYRVIAPPRHGTLSIQGHNLTRNHPEFSQVTLNKFGITYIHDDSETRSDSFTFRAWVAPSHLDSSSSFSSVSGFSSDSSSSFPPLYSASPSSLSSLGVASLRRAKEGLLVTETFNITVAPVNDQPPLIGSRAPSVKVVVGERVVLGPDNLQVEDQDTPPEELHYLVISKPTNGYLTLGERPEPVTSFTQYDVNHGRLHFIQQGEPSAGVFYFNVTDGHHRPLYKLFSLEVIKPTVSMVNNTGLSLAQGRTAVVLTTDHFAAQTNGVSPANITYTVTAHPRHGRIAMNDLEVTTFRHQDLQSGRVVYHMTDLSESEDSFQVSVSASSPGVDYENVAAQTVTVTVRPLVYLREPVRVPSGIAVKLGKAMIDASELARVSRANPVFEVLSPPKHGKLVKMTSDPNRASELLKSFTFRDVVQGRVAIEEILGDDDNRPRDNTSAARTGRGHAPATPLNDSFVFLLRAGNVQPAKGELHFTILPHHQMHHGPGGASKAAGVSQEHETTHLLAQNVTAAGAGGRGVRRGGSTTDSRAGVGLPPHILTHKNPNRTQHKTRPHSRWGNRTRSGSHGGRAGSGVERAGGAPSHSTQPRDPSGSDKHSPATPPDSHPVHVEVLPRPASDPLLIILPLLACLLLIIILIVLILVFRHRQEKQARLQLLQQLARVAPPTEESPDLGRAERSAAMPSVVVTPLGPRSCPSSPRVAISPRRRSLAPGTTFWGPFEADGAGGCGSSGGRDKTAWSRAVFTAGVKTSPRSRSLARKDGQFWV